MKKSFSFGLSSLVALLLSGCALQTEVPSLSGNTAITEDLRNQGVKVKTLVQTFSGGSEYLSGYTGPVALITEKNKDGAVLMTGEELLYRNEVYGFQVKLGKAWKGARIYETEHPDFYNDGKTFYPDLIFEMPSPVDKGEWEPIVVVNIQPFPVYEKAYEFCKNDPSGFCDPSEYEEAEKNNKYRFLIGWYFQEIDIPYEIFYPHLHCKDILINGFSQKDCDSPLQQLFSEWKVFDIK